MAELYDHDDELFVLDIGDDAILATAKTEICGSLEAFRVRVWTDADAVKHRHNSIADGVR